MATKELNFDGVVTPIGAEAQNVDYTNTAMDGVSNVKQALDSLAMQGGGSGGDINLLPLKIVVLGDSIASDAQGIWRDYLNTRYGITTKNYAVGKARYSHKIGTGLIADVAGTTYNLSTTQLTNETATGRINDNTVTNQVNRLIADIQGGTTAEPDVVIIHAGVNDRNDSDTSWGSDGDVTMYGDVDEIMKPLKAADENLTGVDTSLYRTYEGYLRDTKGNNMAWAYAASIGIIKAYDVADADNKSTIATDARLTTMAGGMRFAIETLWAAYPAIKVIVTTPIYTQNTSYNKVRHINTVIKQVASYLSVPVIDLTYESQITPWRYSWQSCDTLHPDVRGAMYMAEAIGAGLVRHFGFLSPMYKYDRKLTINVKDANNNPVSGYSVMLAFNGLWMSTFQDGYKIKSADGTAFPSQTDSNGQIVAWIPARTYLVVHWNATERKQYVLGTADLANNEEVTINYTATDV